MSRRSPESRSSVWDSIAPWLREAGVRSWLYLGIAGLAFLILSLLSFISGLIIPMVIATVISMLFHPVVDILERYNIPRWLGTLLVILLLSVVVGTVLWLTVIGIIEQFDTITEQITLGISSLRDWLLALNLPEGLLDQIVNNARDAAPGAISGIASFFSSSFSGAISFVFGLFLGLVLLFYLLSDWHTIVDWVKRNMGLPEDLSITLLTDVSTTMRLYYYALTLSSLVVTVCIGITMVILDLPLAFTVSLVTMITSYIPYLGAIVSGIFAFLVALGSGTLADALIVLAVVLLVQNVVQTIIQNQLASDQLRMHPLVTFTSTIGGGALFGLLGATLGTPITAMILTGYQRFREYNWEPNDEAVDLIQATDHGIEAPQIANDADDAVEAANPQNTG